MPSKSGSPENSSRREFGMTFWDCACPSGRTYLSRSFWSSPRLLASDSSSLRSSADSGTVPLDHLLPPGSFLSDMGFQAFVQLPDFCGSFLASFPFCSPSFLSSFPEPAFFHSPFPDDSEFSGCFSSFLSPSFEPPLFDSSDFRLSPPLSWSGFSSFFDSSFSCFTCWSRSFFTMSKFVLASSLRSMAYEPVYATSAP